jgi:hypothetical protein
MAARRIPADPGKQACDSGIRAGHQPSRREVLNVCGSCGLAPSNMRTTKMLAACTFIAPGSFRGAYLAGTHPDCGVLSVMMIPIFISPFIGPQNLLHGSQATLAPHWMLDVAIPRRRAHRRSRMGIREPHPLARQPVQVRSRNLAPFRVETVHIPIAEVIGKDIDDVGRDAPAGRLAPGSARGFSQPAAASAAKPRRTCFRNRRQSIRMTA